MTPKEIRIVRAALALVRFWKSQGDDSMEWGHKGHWFPLNSEKQAKALINACIARSKSAK